MAPKSISGGDRRGAAKGKGKGKADTEEKASKVKPAQQVNVRHILCEKFSKKEEALQKLNAGAKFDEVAKEYSEDKPRAGGALGWKSRGDLDTKFEEAAFDLESSTTASPKYKEVKTEFGYHILMVEGRK
ncbi:hypothetical protein BJ878DRAFT_540123 [Calycina marina]|uniref:Peptidyl-prolyl cis-trans isomerase n=1 Tax=Calycina marina TaxID=1763456 RepID=A0A9P7Z832_9HELO|nr:hypothetical protein BJ878DRAFT_540123 [Calycina marina]